MAEDYPHTTRHNFVLKPQQLHSSFASTSNAGGSRDLCLKNMKEMKRGGGGLRLTLMTVLQIVVVTLSVYSHAFLRPVLVLFFQRGHVCTGIDRLVAQVRHPV